MDKLISLNQGPYISAYMNHFEEQMISIKKTSSENFNCRYYYVALQLTAFTLCSFFLVMLILSIYFLDFFWLTWKTFFLVTSVHL